MPNFRKRITVWLSFPANFQNFSQVKQYFPEKITYMPLVTVEYFLLCDTELRLLSWAHTETTEKRTVNPPPLSE